MARAASMIFQASRGRNARTTSARSRRGGGPTRATCRAGPPWPAVEPELLRLPAEGGDQLVLGHRRAALDLQLPSPIPELLDAPLLVDAPVRCGLLLGRVVLGRSLLAVVAEGGDQLVLGHRRATFDLQLAGPLPELLDGALLIGPPVELPVLLGRLSLRGLRLLRVPLLQVGLGGLDEVLDSADALADNGVDGRHGGVGGLPGRVDLTGCDTSQG